MPYTSALGINTGPAAPNSAALTDSTGGTFVDTFTLPAISAGVAYSQADIQALRNCVSTLAVVVNSIRNELVSNGLIKGG